MGCLLSRANFSIEKTNPFTPYVFIFASLCISLQSTSAQITSYNSKGNKISSSSENILIVVNKPAELARGGMPAISLPGVATNIVSVALEIGKTIASNQEAKYAASYSATTSETDLLALRNPQKPSSVFLNIDSINIIREIVSNASLAETACDIVLVPKIQSTSGLFRFKVERLFIPYTKAKIKRFGRGGKMIDLSITIKLDALWQEPTSEKISDSSKQTKAIPSSRSPNDSSYQIKTAALGESTIFISSVIPGGNFPLERDIYSGWFQLIPNTSLKYSNPENNYKVGEYSLSITVNEVNPYESRAKDFVTLANAATPDINTAIKQILSPTAK